MSEWKEMPLSCAVLGIICIAQGIIMHGGKCVDRYPVPKLPMDAQYYFNLTERDL